MIYNRVSISKWLAGAVLSVMVTMSGCSSSAKPVQRKKMPELVDDGDGFESPVWGGRSMRAMMGREGYSFVTSDVDLVVDGRRRSFISVAMPEGGSDTAAIRLLENMKPFALTMLSVWAQQERNGVLIDLAGHKGLPLLSYECVLEKAGDFSIPLVVRYDQASVGRLAVVKQLLGELPASITLKAIE